MRAEKAEDAYVKFTNVEKEREKQKEEEQKAKKEEEEKVSLRDGPLRFEVTGVVELES